MKFVREAAAPPVAYRPRPAVPAYGLPAAREERDVYVFLGNPAGAPAAAAPEPVEAAPAPAAEPSRSDSGRSPGTYVPAPPSTVYRPAGDGDSPRPFLSALPAEYLETRPPLLYRLTTEAERGRAPARIAQSQVYRAKAFSCAFFYKPVTRCVVWEE